MRENLHKEGIEKYYSERLKKIYCGTRKNIPSEGELHNLEHGNHVDNQQEGSSQTLHAGGSGYRRKNHLVHEQADEKESI